MPADKYFVGGTFWRVCDRSGFKTRSYKTRQEWNGLIVQDKLWEIRQPQDFVKGVEDDQSVPLPRPRSVNTFLGPLQTYVTVAANIADITLTVNSSVRMYAGDTVLIQLDNGATFMTMLVAVPTSTTITIQNPLSWTAAINNVVTDQSAMSPPNIG